MSIVDTERFRLRELVHADDAFIMELVNDPDWLRYIGDRNVRSLEDARGYIDRVRTGYEKHGFGLWTIERLTDREALGLCGLLKRDHLEHPDVGFALLASARGQGVAREALLATLRVAHERFGLSRVLAITDLDNAASRGLLEAMGFVLVGTAPEPETGVELTRYGRDLP